MFLQGFDRSSKVRFLLESTPLHSSVPERSTVLTVTWVTEKETPSSAVQFGQVNFTQTVVGAASKFVDGGTLKRTIYVHRATLNDLKPNVRYGEQTRCVDVLPHESNSHRQKSLVIQVRQSRKFRW